MINGVAYDWESVTVNMPHGVLVGIQDISYEDELETEAVYGKGSMPLGHGQGNYKASGKLTLLQEEFENILAYCRQANIALYRLPPIPITVSYAKNGGQTTTRVLRDCKMGKVSEKAAQGAKSLTVDIDITIYGGIDRNGVRPI